MTPQRAETPTERQVSVLLRKIPESLRDRFKAAVSQAGSDMTTALTDFMSDVIRGKTKVRPREQRGGGPRRGR